MTLYKTIYKSSLLFLILFISFFAMAKPAMADAAAGQLFGYKIGNQYPITKKTKRKSHEGGVVALIRTENPVKPENLGDVFVITSAITHTILKIYSERRFRSKIAAEEFATKYVAFLAAKYREHNPQSKDMGETKRLQISFNNAYVLSINIIAPREERPTVRISLVLHDENKKSYLDLIDKEHDQLLINNAKAKGIDKGM